MGVVSLPRNEVPSRTTPARIAQLAKLPVFWELKGQRVIVAGGSNAVAWKAELLAACGAVVHVCALELGQTFTNLIKNGAEHPEGRLIHHQKAWSVSDFEGACLAVADCETEEESRAFLEAGRMTGVPVNVIDKPGFCQFQFGSIVNRSPVIVSISTDGAAPILAQAIRRRIEALLPPALKSWADIARSVRAKVNTRLTQGASRRAFWERFVDRAFTGFADENVVTDLLTDIARDEHSAGHVTFVGAGSDGAELLTLKAVRALQAADVIFFDEPVSDEVLELARREANRIPVGEWSGNINDMILAFSRAGKCVVRLKPGDPAVYDRPVDEIAALEQQGISVNIIPGVASDAVFHGSADRGCRIGAGTKADAIRYLL